MEWQMLDCKLEREGITPDGVCHGTSAAFVQLSWNNPQMSWLSFSSEVMKYFGLTISAVGSSMRVYVDYVPSYTLEKIFFKCSLHFLFFALLPKEDVGKKDKEQEKRTSRGMDCRIRLFLIPQLVKLSTELWMPSQMSLLESGFTLWLLTPHRHRQKDQTITDAIEFCIISIHNSSSVLVYVFFSIQPVLAKWMQ